MSYRDAPINAVAQEMQEAVDLLWRWRRYSPAIAGGALWAWAAGRRARDVDIFLLSTWASRRAMKAIYGTPAGESMGEQYNHDGYQTIASAYAIEVHKTFLPCGSPVDMILCPWGDGLVTDHFDYAHCQVAFGITARIMKGANAYTLADLQMQHTDNRCRTEEKIRAKLQPELWGHHDAAAKLVYTMETLDHILAPLVGEWVEDDRD